MMLSEGCRSCTYALTSFRLKTGGFLREVLVIIASLPRRPRKLLSVGLPRRLSCPRARVERPEVRHWAEQHMRRSPSCVPCMPVKVATFETHRASIGAAKGGRTQCPGLWLVWAAGWLGAAGVREPIVRAHEHGRRIDRTDSSSQSPRAPTGALVVPAPRASRPSPLGCLTRSIFPPSS